MRIAMIRNGIVENIADWDGVAEWHPEGFELIDVTQVLCHIGDTYTDGVFSPPESDQE